MAGKNSAPNEMFDVSVNESLPPAQLLLLGLQNVFGMTGMFVLPGLLGRSFDLPAHDIAALYGMTFIVSGIITILQSVLLLRLPIAQGPYAGSFAALLSVGHLQSGGLGAAYGSFFVASVIWCFVTVPIRGRSIIGMFGRFLRSPMVSGVVVMLIMLQIANVALPNWIGRPHNPGFPFVNLIAGAVSVTTIIAVMLLAKGMIRRCAILLGLLIGTLCYTVFVPVSFDAVVAAPLLVTPKPFPFGFDVQFDLVVIFLLALLPASMGSMALYQTVADWCGEELSSARMSEGVFGVALGSVIAGIFGGFSTIVYPDNIGMLRATRVASRYATLAAGILLVVFGGCIKFDMLLVIVPLPVISATATLLFGIVFMHGVHILARVDWDERHLICAGLSFLAGLGGLFVAPEALDAMPLVLQLFLQQPVILGGMTLVMLHTLLCERREAAEPTERDAPENVAMTKVRAPSSS